MIKESDVMKAAIKLMAKSGTGSPEYQLATFVIEKLLPAGLRDVLGQLVKHGPVYDGDCMSKSGRDTLFDLGLASRAIIKGESGYSVANYHGDMVFRAITAT
ncbi:MAG TPA: hypothetical protein VND94_00915 [Terriglobia bacterium]|nr:hypothetical protein [Terriglobia bacterium]